MFRYSQYSRFAHFYVLEPVGWSAVHLAAFLSLLGVEEGDAGTYSCRYLKNILKTAKDVETTCRNKSEILCFLHMNFIASRSIILFHRLCNSYSLYGSIHRVHTEWQRPLSGVHSIMMGGARLHVTMYAPAERAVTLPLFHL